MKGRAAERATLHPPEPVMQPYTPELEQTMRQFYASLSEKDRRRYAGVEALKLGQGGRNYIARVLGCSRRTVTKGAHEVSGLSGREVEQRIRQPGGGRKPHRRQANRHRLPATAVAY